MKWLIILLGIFFTLSVSAKENSYLGQDYYNVQNMIWICGDSITEIDYDHRTITFTNQGLIRFYVGKIYFNSQWISVKSESHYINYYNNYSIKEYLDTLLKSNIRIFRNGYYIHDDYYYVSKKRGKLLITQKL